MKISDETGEFFASGLLILSACGVVLFLGAFLFGLIAMFFKVVFGSW